jgi:hypothetical protein
VNLLKNDHRVIVLHLGTPAISEVAIHALAEMIKQNETLESIYDDSLEGNHSKEIIITSTVASSLFRALESNIKIQEICLAIGTAGVMDDNVPYCMSELIKENYHYKEWNRKNQITSSLTPIGKHAPSIWEIYYCCGNVPSDVLLLIGKEFLRSEKQTYIDNFDYYATSSDEEDLF